MSESKNVFSHNVFSQFEGKIFLSSKEVATVLRCSRSTLWKYKKSDNFPRTVQILGGRKLYRTSDIINYINKLSA